VRKANELQANLEVARAVGRAFDAFVKDVFHQELAIGIASNASPPLSTNDMQLFLDACLKDNPTLRSFNYVGPDGHILISTNPKAMGMDVSDWPSFQQIVSGREWVVSDLIISKLDGQPVFSICRGIRDKRQNLLGVVLAVILPDRLDSALAIERSHEGGVSLMDSKGMLVYRFPHVQVSWRDRNWAEIFPSFQEALEGKEAVEIAPTTPFDGKSRFIAAAPILSSGWVAGAGRRKEDAMAAITSALIRHGGMFVTVAFLSFLAAVAVSRTIAGPIRRMQEHLIAHRASGPATRFAVSGPAEIRELAVPLDAKLNALRLSFKDNWIDGKGGNGAAMILSFWQGTVAGFRSSYPGRQFLMNMESSREALQPRPTLPYANGRRTLSESPRGS
jgi:hypothetical protein